MRISKFVFAIGIAALLGSVALTQPPEGKGEGKGGDGKGKGGMRGGGMMRGNPVFLISNSGVQEELKVTDEQKDKIKELQKTAREKFEDIQSKDAEDRPVAMREANEAMLKSIKEILKPEQAKRFNEIRWQQSGVNAFTDTELQTTLKLSDEQKSKVKGIVEELRKDTMELFRDGGGRESRQKMESLNKEAKDKVMAALDDTQKKSYEAALGKPFEVKMERGGFGGGGEGKGKGRGKGKDGGEPKNKVDD
ncbi:MAG: hypothetical protein ACJ8C4_21470 [Gemmataceae bacterium]